MGKLPASFGRAEAASTKRPKNQFVTDLVVENEKNLWRIGDAPELFLKKLYNTSMEYQN